MTRLSRRKIRFIKDNQGKLSLKETAVKLGISVSEVKMALEYKEEGVSERTGPFENAISYTFLILLLISPLIFYPRIQDFSNLPKSFFIHLAVCMLLLFRLLKVRFSREIEVVRHPMILFMGLWILWTGITVSWSADRFGGLMLWLHWFICGICFMVFINSVSSTAQLDRMIFFIVFGAAVISVIGILQYTVGWDFIPQGGIPGTTFSNKNVAVQFIIIVWPLSLLMFLLQKKRGGYVFHALIHSLIVIFLLYSRTRAGWIALAVSLLVLIFFLLTTRFRLDIRSSMPAEKGILLICSVVFIILMAMIPQKTPPGKKASMGYLESLSSISKYEGGSARATTTRVRLAMWLNSFEMIRDTPIWGVGLSGWHIHYPLYQNSAIADPIFSNKEQPAFAHNESIQLLAETSALGLLLYALMFMVILWRSLTSFCATNDTGIRLRVVFGITALVAFTINSFFTFPLRMAVPPLFLMIVFGFLVSLDIQVKRHSDDTLFIKEPGRVLITVKKNLLNGMILLAAVFTILLIFFDSRIILADHHYLRSSYFNRIKDWKTAKAESLKAVSYIPWRYRLWFELGKAADHLGLDGDAIDAYKNALGVHPNHLNSLLNMGHIYLKKGDYKNAAIYTLRALRIKQDFNLALYNMGIIKEKQGMAKEAALHYQKAIRANPEYAEARYRLGLIYLKENSMENAKEQFENAARLKPDAPGIHFNLGLVYDRLNMPEKAADEYRKEIGINPEEPAAYTNLGLILAKKKKWEEAISHYKKSIQLDPEFGAAHLNIGVAYYMLGDYESSLKHALIGKELGLPQAGDLIQRLKTTGDREP
ncbi:MAG: tetratricopeptide repeat protein [Deltaproteobacteria bacterium]|nr:tetratricopeptide repeat protein [Deltaproteobacteria bacterium]